MTGFSDKVYIRHDTVDGVGPWVWPKGDTGLWDGPKSDWEDCHVKKIFPLVRKFDICVQAGSGCGMYPRLLAEKFSLVYTFEPFYLSFYCLTMNCQVDNVLKYQAVLGDSNDPIVLAVPDMTNLGMNQVLNDPSKLGVIPSMMIDQLKLPACDLIWLDVEGYERKVVLGALETIKKYRPLIVAERGYQNDLPALMDSLGYAHVGGSSMDTIFLPKEFLTKK